MMLTVIIVFMLCWTPLYALYCYFFLTPNRDSIFFHFASSVLRPIFQWLSLLSSSINPLIYIAYSQKYRIAFHKLLLLPCQVKYANLRSATRSKFHMSPDRRSKEDKTSTLSSTNPSKKYTLLAQSRGLSPTASMWSRENSERIRNPQSHFYSQDEGRKDENSLEVDGKGLAQRKITPPARLLAPPSIDLYGPVSYC